MARITLNPFVLVLLGMSFLLGENSKLLLAVNNFSRDELLVEEAAVIPPPKKKHKSRRRHAIASFVDSPDHLIGAYSISSQMAKFNMSGTIEQVVVVENKFPKKYKKEWKALTKWMEGNDKHIVQIDKAYIFDKIQRRRLWKGTFNKLWLFNLTDFDRLIVLDTDIFIRTNIAHWFDYPTPCATQPSGEIEYNSGAMVIEPSAEVFEEMIELLPKVTMYNPDKHHGSETWNSGYGHQGFISSYFTRSHNVSNRIKTMPIESAPLSSYLMKDNNHMRYYTDVRPYIIETIHFTSFKPYRAPVRYSDPFICDAVAGWYDSVQEAAEELKFERILGDDKFEKCPNATRYARFRPKTSTRYKKKK